MGVKQLIGAVKEAGLRIAVIMLALILAMIVASRNVEFEREQETLTGNAAVESVVSDS